MGNVRRASWAAAVLGALVGCGRVTERGGPADAADAGSGTPPARCDPGAPFGDPVALTSLDTSADDEHPDLTADELTIYFSSNRPDGAGGYDVYQATRASSSDPFGKAVPVPGINTATDERSPRMSADRLAMFAVVRSSLSSGFHIGLATRGSVAVAFGGLQMVASVNNASNAADPYLLSGGNVMYLTSDLAGNLGLYRTAKVNGAFASPSPVPGVDLDSPSDDNNPVVTADELTLFFGSKRTGGLGDYDIYEARRASVADGFGAAVALTRLNSSGTDAPSWISPDGCHLYFTRLETNLGYQLYMASRGR